MFTVFLGLGTNIGTKQKNLEECIKILQNKIGEIVSVSSFYETEPWGVSDQENYLNLVVNLKTNLFPIDLLTQTQAIENEMGRIKLEKWGSRIIDIDILFFEDYHFNMQNLTVPHPYISERNFVLNPLEEIAPDFIHPKYQKSIKYLKENCLDTNWIRKL